MKKIVSKLACQFDAKKCNPPTIANKKFSFPLQTNSIIQSYKTEFTASA